MSIEQRPAVAGLEQIRSQMGVLLVNKRFALAGGFDSDGKASNLFGFYTPCDTPDQPDTYEAAGNLPVAMANFSLVEICGNLYAFGGQTE